MTDAAATVDKLMAHPSDWRRLKRFVAIFVKLKLFLMDKALARKGHVIVHRCPLLSPTDVLLAESVILRWLQWHCFPQDYTSLMQSGSVQKSSRLASLDPFMEDGLIKVGGRLRKANLPDANKHPVILPKSSHISSLIIRREHCLLGHVGRTCAI